MKNIKLFWIDDMESWALSAQKNLQLISPKYEIDLHIVNAINGEEIFQLVMQYDFDCIVMDYHMKPFNGDKYIKDIREEEHLDDVPILFYSQDNNVDLNSKIGNLRNVITIFRPNLEDKIKELFFR